MTHTDVIRLHRTQYEFRRSTALYRGFVGGISSGKSFVTSYDLIRRAKPNRLYMYVCPSYKMLKRADLRTLTKLARDLRFFRGFSKSDMILTLGNNAEIVCCSADEPDSLRGPNASGIVLCEASLMDRDAYDICIARLREEGEQGWLSAGFTPKGQQHWTYETFGAGKPDTELFFARTSDNPFNPPNFSETLRKQYTSAYAEQELDGQFIDLRGSLAKREWFEIVTITPPKGRRVRAWDFAASKGSASDYTVGTLMLRGDDGVFYVEDVVRDKTGPAGVEQLVKRTAQADGRSVAVSIEQEPGSSGMMVVNTMTRLLAGWNVTATKPSADKVTRAMPFLAQAQGGNVKLKQGNWVRSWLDELCSFPNGEHDDMVDSASSAFNYLTTGQSSFVIM